MKMKFVWATLSVGIIAALVGNQLLSSNKGRSDFAQKKLLAMHSGSFDLGSISKVEIKKAEDETISAAEKVLQDWQMPDYQGYAANTKLLSELLQDIKDAKVVELKTSKVKNHGRLGLRALSDGDSEAKLVTLSNGQSSIELLVGKSATTGTGQYVRYADNDQTFLIDKIIELPDSGQDWLAPQIFDFEFDEVRKLRVQNSDNQEFQIKREEVVVNTEIEEPQLPLSEKAGYELADNFHMVGLAEDEELQYGSILDGLVRNVLGMKVKDVMLKQQSQGLRQSHEFELLIKQNNGVKSVQFSLLTDDQETPSYWLSMMNNQWLMKISDFDYKQVSKNKIDYLVEPESAE